MDTILCSLPSKYIAFSPPYFCIHHLHQNGPPTKQTPHFQCYHPLHCEHKFTCMTVFAYGPCAFRFGIIVCHYKIYLNLAVCSSSTFFARFTQIQLYVYLLIVCLNYMTLSYNSCFNFTHSLLENHRQKCKDTSTLKVTSKQGLFVKLQ